MDQSLDLDPEQQKLLSEVMYICFFMNDKYFFSFTLVMIGFCFVLFFVCKFSAVLDSHLKSRGRDFLSGGGNVILCL